MQQGGQGLFLWMSVKQVDHSFSGKRFIYFKTFCDRKRKWLDREIGILCVGGMSRVSENIYLSGIKRKNTRKSTKYEDP